MGIFSSKQETKHEKERNNRKSYLQNKLQKRVDRLLNMTLLLQVQNKTTQNIVASLVNKLNSDLLGLENIQSNILPEKITNIVVTDFEHFLRLKEQEYNKISKIMDNFLCEKYPAITNIIWQITNNENNYTIAPNGNQPYNLEYNIPNDENLNGKKIKVRLSINITYPKMLVNDVFVDNTNNEVIDHETLEQKIGEERDFSKNKIKLYSDPKINNYSVIDISNLALEFSVKEVDTFVSYISGRGSIESIYSIDHKYREHLETMDTTSFKSSENYRVVPIGNIYNHILNECKDITKKLISDKMYYENTDTIIAKIVNFFRGHYAEKIQDFINIDVNFLTSDIETKRTHILSGKKNFEIFKQKYFHILRNRDFMIGEEPNRDDFNTENDFNQALMAFDQRKTLCTNYLTNVKTQLNSALAAFATSTGASAVINDIANNN